MNKTKIEWCDSTWNPVTGCLHGCEYCYARKIANRFGTLNKIVESAAAEGISLDGAYFSNPDYFSELSEPVCDENGKIEPYPTNFYPTFHKYRLDEPQKQKNPRTIFVCSMADLFGDCWTFETDIPHETFDIYEDGELYCKGVVFNLSDCKKPKTNFEKIKALSIDEMAEFVGQKPFCALENGDVDCIYGWHDKDCVKHAKDWLESECE